MLRERAELSLKSSKIKARPRGSESEAPTNGEEPEAMAASRDRLEAIRFGTPGVHADSRSDDNITEDFPESLPEVASAAIYELVKLLVSLLDVEKGSEFVKEILVRALSSVLA